MVTFVAYYRVSTAKQGVLGLGIEAQQQAVRQYVTQRNGSVVAAYTEVESGKRKDRPQLLAALAHCRALGATLIVAKLDRLARNVQFISTLMESRTEFVAVDMPTANRLTIHVLAAVAEHEAQMISERTKAALAVARQRGVKLGGWRRNSGQDIRKDGGKASAAKRKQQAQQRAQDYAPVFALLSDGSLTYKQMADRLNASGIPTPQRKQWHAASVRNVICRLNATNNTGNCEKRS